MPGIKSTRIKLAGTPINLLSLAVLALLFSHPAVADESRASIQTLEWSGDTPSGAPESEPAAEASLDDVWQRLRSGFRIDDAAAQNPLVAVHESWFAARPASVRRLVERSRPYLYHILEELHRRGLQVEIATLP